MIPNGTSMTIVFICMALNSALLLLARSASTALLMLVNPMYVWYYVLGDACFFFLQKIARGDIHSYVNVNGWFGVVVFDFLVHLIWKSIADYTGLLQFRAAGVLGGAYFTTSAVRA